MFNIELVINLSNTKKMMKTYIYIEEGKNIENRNEI